MKVFCVYMEVYHQILKLLTKFVLLREIKKSHTKEPSVISFCIHEKFHNSNLFMSCLLSVNIFQSNLTPHYWKKMSLGSLQIKH